ncbi:MAG TPA: thiamine diphosphokinase [Candidatus Saccharimonadales bacterium]|nr:thiamine diphosphokinase [Candidatus Saccharimonadales bacterium]
MRSLVVFNGDLPDVAWLAAEARRADLVIAADAAADALLGAGIRPGLVVGDLDSLSPAAVAILEEAGVPVERHPREKDATDGELALRAAVTRGATVIRIAGALGGPRVDHAIASLTLLALPALAGRDVALITPTDTVRLLRGPVSHRVAGTGGDLISLLPLSGPVTGVTTAGLRYALERATLELGPTLGLSNELIGNDANIEIRAGALIVTTHRAYH